MYILLSDFTRWVVSIVALWLIAVLLRMSFIHWRANGWDRYRVANPITVLGICGYMGIVISRRFDSLGEPGDAYLWCSAGATVLVLVGVLLSVRFPHLPPHRRPR